MLTHRLRVTAAGAGLVAVAALAGLPAPPGSAGSTAEEERTVGIRAVEPRDDVFFVKGRVRPAYENRRAVVQRKLRREKEWSRWRRFETSSASRYRERVAPLKRQGVVCYRVRVPASDGYPEALSQRICVRTFWK